MIKCQTAYHVSKTDEGFHLLASIYMLDWHNKIISHFTQKIPLIFSVTYKAFINLLHILCVIRNISWIIVAIHL